MDEHDLSSISPAVHGGGHHISTHPRTGQPLAKCVAQVEMTEVYFQIFTRDAWLCFYSQLEYPNGRGFCYDKCYAANCGGVNAVDYRMEAYHLERTGVPAHARNSEQLALLSQKRVGHAAAAGKNQSYLCAKNKCSTSDDGLARFDKWQTVQNPIVCDDDSQNDFNKKNNIMHTFFHPDVDDKSMLKVWSDSWSEAGWDIQILNLYHARRHPDFNEVNHMLSSSEPELELKEKLAFLKYLALPVEEGGWYADQNVLPLHLRRTEEKGLGVLPNGGRFTIHEGKRFGLLSGSKEEWDRIIRFIVERRKKLPSVTLEEARNKYPYVYKYENNVVSMTSLGKLSLESILCDDLKDKLAVHIDGSVKTLSDTEQQIGSDEEISSFAKLWVEKFQKICLNQD